MTTSVNTNLGAMLALQTLRNTTEQLARTQERINTGLKVASAKDDGATYAIAQTMRGEIAGYQAVLERLDAGKSVVDVALNAATQISQLLTTMKQKAVAAADGAATSSDRVAYQNDFNALRTQITTIVQNAIFNGVNLLDGSSSGGGSTTVFNVIANTQGGTNVISVTRADLSVTNGLSLNAVSLSGTDSANAQAALNAINTAISTVSAGAGQLGVGAIALGTHQTFISGLVDTLKAGIGNLVDANLPEESARLQALQVKQQLGVQALSIANQAPQLLLSLFRNG